jgi:hypothetical protein
MTGLTIPTGVTVLEYHAFYRCDSLAAVIIPGSVTTIGEEARANCCEALTTRSVIT